MISRKKIRHFVDLLIQHTKRDKILWQHTDHVALATEYKGFKFWTEWLRGEAPTLQLDSVKKGETEGGYVQAHGLGLSELHVQIDKQFRRRRSYQYSPEAMSKEQQRRCAADVAGSLKGFVAVMEDCAAKIES